MTNFAFHNDLELAAAIRAQVEAHTTADEIIQGAYWENGKGCFIGCIAHDSDPDIVEQMTGFPVMLTKIAESIFEGLPNEEAKSFPQRVIQSVTVGADLSLVSWKFLHWLVGDVLREHADDATRAACSPVLEILSAKSCGEDVSYDAAYAAAYAADAADAAYALRAAEAAASAAADAAEAAASAAAEAAYALRAAAYAAAYAADAAYAPRAAASAAAEAAAYSARIHQADKLVEMLSGAV